MSDLLFLCVLVCCFVVSICLILVTVLDTVCFVYGGLWVAQFDSCFGDLCLFVCCSV